VNAWWMASRHDYRDQRGCRARRKLYRSLPVNAAPTRSAYPAVMLSDSAHVESLP
jgi:hypothetical protein